MAAASAIGRRQRRLNDGYDRTLVRKLFDKVVNMPGSDARMVSGRRGLDYDGDGRKANLLFPTNVPDQLVADCTCALSEKLAGREAST